MNKSTIALGIILIIIGVIMFVIGQDKYEEAQLNYQYAKAFGVLFGGDLSSTKTSMDFWGGFTYLGLIIFILGIPIAIAGAIVGEKEGIKLQKPIDNRRCPNCGRSIPMDAVRCPYCEKRFVYEDNEEKQIIKSFVCPKCGIELEGTPKFCYKCGVKLK